MTAYNLLLTTLTTSFLFCVASQFFLGRNSTDHGRFDLLGMDKLLSRVWKMVPCHGIHGAFRLSIPSGNPTWFVNVYNVFIMENPMKKGDLGGSPIRKPPHPRLQAVFLWLCWSWSGLLQRRTGTGKGHGRLGRHRVALGFFL